MTKVPWFAYVVNYLVTKSVPEYWSMHQKRKFSYDIGYYFWKEPQLFHVGADQIIRQCVPEEEEEHILVMCHSSLCGGHFASRKTEAKVLQSGLDGEYSQDISTRVSSEPIYAPRKRNHPQLQQHTILFLIYKFEKPTIHDVSEEDLLKSLKESVDPKEIIFPPLPFLE